MMRKHIRIRILFAIVGFSFNLLFTGCSLIEASNEQVRYSKEDYREIDLQPLNSNNSLIGSEPEEIALKTFGISQNSNLEKTSQETINTIRDSQSNFVVSITQMGLPDDSIKGIRYRIEFEPYDNSSSNPQWQMTWAGQQFTCQPGRGKQNWTTNYCY